MTDELILEVDRLSLGLPVGADREFAIRDVSFTVSRGKTVCVVGESGSGKTLLSHSIMQLLNPAIRVTGGAVRLKGRNLLEMSPQAIRSVRGKDIGMIFQEPISSLNPVRRVGRQTEDAIRDPGRHRGRIETLFESVGLPASGRYYDRFPHQLSGGQCQRILIALALANDPKLLIADEPTTALDMTTQKQILALIKSEQERRGLGVLFVTHDFGVVAEIADTVVVMRAGEVVESGPAEQVLRHPQQDYTKLLLDAVPGKLSQGAVPSGTVSTQKVLEARKLSKTYSAAGPFAFRGGRKQVLQDISLTIHAGETVALVGGSGSGKSTLAQCLIRLVEPDSGNVDLVEQPFLSLRGKPLRNARRAVQMIFQDPMGSFNPRMTIGEALVRGPIAAGVAPEEARERAYNLLERVSLPIQSMQRYPYAFSGGQRQRIAIARALCMEPRLLIADEPTSALDVTVQKEILSLLQEFQRSSDLAILFITHDLRLASMVAHRTIVLESGQIVEQGNTLSLLQNPKSETAQRLVMSSPGFQLEQAQDTTAGNARINFSQGGVS
jgi:peptide/nickel transport system ATP-binding protein